MESLLLQEQSVLQKLVTALEAMQSIPPDIREDRGFDQALEELVDAVDLQQSRVDLRKRHLEVKKIPEPMPFVDTETLTEKECPDTYHKFVEVLDRVKDHDPNVQAKTIVGLLNTAGYKDLISQYGVHLIYDPGTEILSMLTGEGKSIFALQGEDAYEELRSSLVQPWYGQLSPTEVAVGVPDPVGDRQQALEIQAWKQNSNKVLIGKLFAAFYECLDVKERGMFSCRFVKETDSVYLTLYGEDIAGYRLSNVAWPHLKEVKNSRGKMELREKGDWGKLSPFERGAIRRKFMKQNDLGLLYFNPLRRIGKSLPFDGRDIISRHLAGWLDEYAP